MKKNILIYIMCLVSFTSCENWLDVQPKTKIKSDVLLTSEEGFLDALAGVYTLAKSDQLYGREMSFGFTDALIGGYNASSNKQYSVVANWDYKDETVKAKIAGMFSKSYNAIANCNNILDQIDNQKNSFRGINYNLVKGEALGLRAFLHFDLLRLYGSANLAKNAIPYSTTLSSDIVPMYTGEQVVKLLLNDLNQAKQLLKEDPIIKGKPVDSNASEFEAQRKMRFNYYAVVATIARVSMWAKNYNTAFDCADEILKVQEEIFPWILSDNISGEKKNRDYTFSTEHIFGLSIHNLATIANRWFISANEQDALYRSAYNLDQVYADKYGTKNDYRLQYICEVGPNTIPFWGGYLFYKYYQPEGYNVNYAKRIPLIKIAEMYYIAAEVYLNRGDLTKAIEMLETVRAHRGISIKIPTDLAPDAIRAEILKEYRKEFQCEGQIFFYCKRLGLARFPGHYKDTPEEVYTLPLPDDEIEFGDREK